MKHSKNRWAYALIVVIAVLGGRFLVLEAQAKKDKDPAVFSTCDEPQPDETNPSE